MRKIIIGCIVATAVALAGCSAQQIQTTQTAAQKFQADVTLACNIFEPAIAPWAPLFVGNPAFSAFNIDATAVCAGNALLNLASVSNVVNSSGAAAQAAIALIPGLTPQQVALAQSVVGALAGSLKNAYAAYQSSVSLTTSMR
ncbi:hypothetical protein AWB78_01355 [Caballeronia calidae]|uniref:Lipoprotein n=1 Tax=Caballeronia calidae TaxID=1777139 RepID=A0A158A7J2_9BURK|nr:hypothetical protein [Caballeronia calidae]SAK53740.1 hypothetical protein AWB78_01355 [Caballeronia calidae]